jgi:CheY-like chemotaxis protein
MKLRIMIVDDAPVNCKMILRTLQMCQVCEDAAVIYDGRAAVQYIRDKINHQVSTRTSGRPRRVRKSYSGVSNSEEQTASPSNDSHSNGNGNGNGIAESQVPQVIFMDYFLPYMNGPDAVRQIRQLGYEGLIIGVTGNAVPDDIRDFADSGVNKVMMKPMDVEDLKNTILEHCCGNGSGSGIVNGSGNNNNISTGSGDK